MTDLDLTRLRELHEKATAAPWFVEEVGDYGDKHATIACARWKGYVNTVAFGEDFDTARAVAETHNAFPGLLDALDAAQAEVERQARQLDEGGKEWSRMATEHDTLLGKANAMDDWKARAEKAERELAEARATIARVRALADDPDDVQEWPASTGAPGSEDAVVTVEVIDVTRLRAALTDSEKGA